MYPSISVKRGFVLILAVVLLLGCFTGCGRKKADKPTEPATIPPQLMLDETESAKETTAPTEAATEATEAATEATKETQPQGFPGVIAGEAVNIRTGPGTNYGAIGSLSAGTKVYIQEVNLKGVLPWGQIEEGWICLEYVQLDDPDELLVYSLAKQGFTLNNGIQLYNGPGTFYGKAGKIDKDVRLNIFGTVGQWIRIAEGWLLDDHVYIDCTEGPEEPQMGTVTGSGVNIRSGPGTQYSTVTSVNKGTRMKIFFIKEEKDVKWGCGEVGWICMDYVLLDGDPVAKLLGSWCGYKSTDQMSATSHIFVEWNFTASGQYTFIEWMYDESMGTATNKMQTISRKEGKFSYDGTNLKLDDKEVTFTLQETKLTLDSGNGSKVHLKGKMEDAVKAFLAEKYPDGMPEDSEQETTTPTTPAINSAILGSWSAARAYTSADGVKCFTMGDNWTFKQDGTFQLKGNTGFWVYNDDGTLGNYFEGTTTQKSGTFSFDGTNLYITLSDGTVGTGTASVQNGVLTVRWGSGSENMYQENAETLAPKLYSGA